MRWSTFLYGLWCLGITGAFLLAAVNGVSPFADGGRPTFSHGGMGFFGYGYGPRHK